MQLKVTDMLLWSALVSLVIIIGGGAVIYWGDAEGWLWFVVIAKHSDLMGNILLLAAGVFAISAAAIAALNDRSMESNRREREARANFVHLATTIKTTLIGLHRALEGIQDKAYKGDSQTIEFLAGTVGWIALRDRVVDGRKIIWLVNVEMKGLSIRSYSRTICRFSTIALGVRSD